MHGVQLSANSTPSSGAPARPARGRTDGRAIRPATGKRSNTPANNRPSRMVRPPSSCVSTAVWLRRTAPRLPNSRPSVANTAEKPITNSAVPASVRLRARRAASAEASACWASVPDMPVT